MRSVQYLSELISFPTISSDSNAVVTERIQQWLTTMAFLTERLDYFDQAGVIKSCLIARKGPVGQGVAYFGHSDVVPVNSWSFPESGPWQAHVTDDRVYGRGSCDMKGSVACMLAAIEATVSVPLKAPVYVVVTADEEVGMRGAREVVERSVIYREIVTHQSRAIIGEPTSLDVVYAHKGGRAIRVTSHGRAAHSSTGLGVNANLAMIPFLAAVKELHDQMETDPAWRDDRFTPPTPSMNITISDYNDAVNITAPRSVSQIYFRPLPGQNADIAVEQIRQIADRHGLQFELHFSGDPLFTDPESPFIQELISLTGNSSCRTVSYGTDGAVFTELKNVAVIGPGSIDQAHTDDEWIALEQMQRGTDLYEQLIRHWCVD